MLDSSLMQLMWLASPALPVGGFSYSECLETAVDTARAATESEASAWLVDHLHLSLARSDLPALAQGIAAWRAEDFDRVRTLNAWVLQTRESAELRAQTEQMGKSLLEWLKNHTTATPAQHDGMVAAVSHLPHWIAALFMQHIVSSQDSTLKLQTAGSGFRDFTRVAQGSAEMWSDIFMANRDAMLHELKELRCVMERAEQALEDSDEAWLRDMLESAAKSRANWPGNH